MTIVVVERIFDMPASIEELTAKEEGGAWCMDLYKVKYLHTYFSVDRKKMLCLYEAADAESVRQAQEQIGMPVTSIWSADYFDTDSMT